MQHTSQYAGLTWMDLVVEEVGRQFLKGVPGRGAALAPDPVDRDHPHATPLTCLTGKQTKT